MTLSVAQSVVPTVRRFLRGIYGRLRRTKQLAAPPYAGVIKEAERCRADPKRARRFRENGGIDRLNRAIETADGDNRDEWVDRGRAAQDALTRMPKSHGTTIPDDE